MRFFNRSVIIIAAISATLGVARGQSARDYRLQFHQGDIRGVAITEVLSIEMRFPQVDSGDAKPSVRTSSYYYTETVEKVNPDGYAVIGAVLDSFKTGISIGGGKDAQSFFKFNSNNEDDIQHEFHDIKVMPRAQFLGNTLRFTMRPDGTIANFLNLQDFHANAIGRDYDYNMVHAMLSLTDSLRMGQLLEFGFGGLAAVGKPYKSPSTATEIPITRAVSTTQSGNGMLQVRVSYFNAPQKIDYLEGISAPLGILEFHGGGAGEITFLDGYLKHSEYQDSANVILQVDIDKVPEEIKRTATTDVYTIPVLHGGKVSIREVKSHRGVPKEVDDDPTKRPTDSTMVKRPGLNPTETPGEK